MNGESSRIVMRLPGRNALTAVLLIGAVLLGALAVHSMMNSFAMSSSAMASGSMGTSPLSEPDSVTVEASDVVSTMAEDSATAAASSIASIMPTLATACVVSCTTDWHVVSVICAVAALAVFLAVVLLHHSVRRAVFTQIRDHAAVVASRIPLPRPPSLLILSISRT